ncbi:MAG TPA: hypothetical protein VIJ14_10470 [Rhabdochlamydiaceae bacterium]
MMIPIPSPDQGRFLPPAPPTLLPSTTTVLPSPQLFQMTSPPPSVPSPPVFRFDPINLKFPTLTPSIPSPPVFPRPLPDLKNFNFDRPVIPYPRIVIPHTPLVINHTPPVASPLEQKVTAVFLLTFIWISTALTIAAIAREKGFAKRYETSMALIGATAVTILTYANVPIGLSSMAIILIIGLFVCKPSLSSQADRDFYNQHFPPNRYHPPNIPILNAQLLAPNLPPYVPVHHIQPVIQPWNHVPPAQPSSSGAVGG